jgi:hypothetical protein
MPAYGLSLLKIEKYLSRSRGRPAEIFWLRQKAKVEFSIELALERLEVIGYSDIAATARNSVRDALTAVRTNSP